MPPVVAPNIGTVGIDLETTFQLPTRCRSPGHGYSFADQVTLLLKAAPCFIDYALTLFQEGDADDYGKAADAFTQFFGSADPNEYPSG